MILGQVSLIGAKNSIRIGTNRELSARVIGPDLQSIIDSFPNSHITVHAFENGVENALLSGQIDLGLDCDRPTDPDIAFELMVSEPIVAVASPEFMKSHGKQQNDETFHSLPHLLCHRLQPDQILSFSRDSVPIVARFNDIGTTRSACVASVGWALLPRYAVESELASGALILLDKKLYGNSKYGIWWLRRRKYFEREAMILKEWLGRKTL